MFKVSKNHINLLDMIQSFASTATTSQVAKNETNEKCSNITIFNSNFRVSRDRNLLKYFSVFFV